MIASGSGPVNVARRRYDRRLRAVIFDFNGVLVDDESVHFALFREVLAQEGVTITEQDYHERYLGYDDRGCFEAALLDAGQSRPRGGSIS